MTWSMVSAPDLSEQEFSDWQKMLAQKLGIFIGDNRKQFLQSQVAIRMRELGEASFLSYFLTLHEGESGRAECDILLDRLLVKETSFFRHQPSYDFLRTCVQDKLRDLAPRSVIKALSLGCATGEEAYSIAMLLNEMHDFQQVDAGFRVVGVDLSISALEHAEAAQYSNNKIHFVPEPLRQKYFSGHQSGELAFDHQLASKVRFIRKDIVDFESGSTLNMDVIFCQNVLIYFEPEKRKKILNAIVDNLKAGAILILGLGEVMDWRNPLVERFARADVQAYRKLSG